jgi:hypothetical protein
MESMLGTYFSVVSIIVVFQMLLLQHWLDRVGGLVSASEDIINTTPVGDMARRRLTQSIDRIRAQFPWVYMVTLFLAVSLLDALAVAAALRLPAIPFIYSMSPSIVLWLTFVVGIGWAWIRGMRELDHVKRLL